FLPPAGSDGFENRSHRSVGQGDTRTRRRREKTKESEQRRGVLPSRSRGETTSCAIVRSGRRQRKEKIGKGRRGRPWTARGGGRGPPLSSGCPLASSLPPGGHPMRRPANPTLSRRSALAGALAAIGWSALPQAEAQAPERAAKDAPVAPKDPLKI